MSGFPFSVSVIIPVYNGAKYLAEAVASIVRQDHAPLEIIIVDDGSTDETSAVARSLPGNIRYIYQPNSGAASARNLGLEMAIGDVICFLDADDMWSDDKLAVQLALLSADDALQVALGSASYFREAYPGDTQGQYDFYPESFPLLGLGAVAARRRVFDQVGLLDPELTYFEDVDWCIRVREAGISMLVHPEVVWLYRRHKENITNQKERMNHYFVLALKKSLDRRRAKGSQIKPLPSWFNKKIGEEKI